MSIDANQLLLLLNWMSPAFPTGAFAYSHGLEWTIDCGDVQSADELRNWISDLVTRGSVWNDAVLFARCWEDDLDMLNDTALALCSSRERHLETTQLGRAFAIAAHVFAPQVTDGGELAYPVAAGRALAALRVNKEDALLAFLQGFCAALTSVAVRLVPLGQTRGLEVLRDLMPVITATAVRAGTATLDDLGSITLNADIAAMKHETLLSRVFRT
jgi:urease accessory protein